MKIVCEIKLECKINPENKPGNIIKLVNTVFENKEVKSFNVAIGDLEKDDVNFIKSFFVSGGFFVVNQYNFLVIEKR